MGKVASKNQLKKNTDKTVSVNGLNISGILPSGFDEESFVFEATAAEKTKIVNNMYRAFSALYLDVDIKTPRINVGDSTCTWKLLITSVEKRHIPRAY